MRKYRLSPGNGGQARRRIISIRDGSMGGHVQGLNLSQHGTCWIADGARAVDLSWVKDDARLEGHAIISERVQVAGRALVTGNACLSGSIWVGDDAVVSGDVNIAGHARIMGNAQVRRNEEIVFITGLIPYDITVTPQNAAIGCRVLSHREWLGFPAARARNLGLDRARFELLGKVLPPIFRRLARLGNQAL